MIKFGDTVTVTGGPHAGITGTVVLLGDANIYPNRNPNHEMVTIAPFGGSVAYLIVPLSHVTLATQKGNKLKAVIGGQEVELDFEIVTSGNSDMTWPWPHGTSLTEPAEAKCDCGAVKCKTTHAEWCSTQKR